MVTTEPYSPNKNLIDAIDAQLESIRKLLSILRDNDPGVYRVDPSTLQYYYYTTTPYFTPEDLKNTKITCNTESK